MQPPEPLDPQIAALIDAYQSKQITPREFHEVIYWLRLRTAIDGKQRHQAGDDELHKRRGAALQWDRKA